MARRCELTETSVMSGNKVSNSNRKVRREFRPNLVWVWVMCETLGHRVRVRMTQKARRTLDQSEGLDEFLLENASKGKLSPRMQKLFRKVAKKKKRNRQNMIDEGRPEGGSLETAAQTA